MHADLLAEVDDIIIETDLMAGYFLVAWNDEGHMFSTLSLGKRNPFSAPMLPEMIEARVVKDVAELEPA
jgi:hypothetical protein